MGILAGVPGTGKTFVAAYIIARCVEAWGLANVAVCAPTGKAAVRLTGAMTVAAARLGVGTIRATTIHQRLEIGRNGHDGRGWAFQRNARNPLEQRFVFVDEVSMLDTDLAAALFAALPAGAHVLLIGDPHQLPPVGKGAPLRDLIRSRKAPCGRLEEIRRNAGAIVEACAKIRRGERFDLGENLVNLPVKHAEDFVRFAFQQVQQAKVDSFVRDTQFLVATNKGPLGRVEVNKVLQELYNPHGTRAEGNPFRVMDKVICLRNGWYHTSVEIVDDISGDADAAAVDAYVANGEQGTVLAVSDKDSTFHFTNPGRVITVENVRRKTEDGEEEGSVEDFALGYAITCHKSQGSEWPVVAVLIDEGTGARQICSREWLYTAISRAGRLCYMVGDMAVARMMPRRPQLDKRKTRLAELLMEEQHNAAATGQQT